MTVDLASPGAVGYGPGPLALGAPGVYFAPDVPQPRLALEPMDVAAFVGIAPRGPAWEPVDDPSLLETGTTHARSVAVAVDSWDDYVERFGAFEGPGLLPRAVAAYFAQGGRRCYVIRIVSSDIARDGLGLHPEGCAELGLDPPGAAAPAEPALRLRARNEGSWGNRLSAVCRFSARALQARARPGLSLLLAPGAILPVGSLVRLRTPGHPAAITTVSAVQVVGRPASTGHDTIAFLDGTITVDDTTTVEVIETELEIQDHDPRWLRQETFTGLGLVPRHPRYVAEVLRRESRLVDAPDPMPADQVRKLVGPELEEVTARNIGGGEDRWPRVDVGDIFGRLLDGDERGIEGLDALLDAPEVATVVVPDLYAFAEPEPTAAPPLTGDPSFRPCLPDTVAAVGSDPVPRGLDGLYLDPRRASDRREIVERQRRLVAVAERLELVALLDVPPGLRPRPVLAWRSELDSSYAAAYHPWLRAPVGDERGPLGLVPPSAVAAGIIARCELRQGISRGPANELALGMVAVTDSIDDAQHGELHGLGVNVLVVDPDGVRLTGARTVSSDPAWRQLTVRRLLLLIERAVRRQLQWAVFEPGDERLRAGLRRQLDQLLGELFALGAFAGATADESWFVHVASGAELRAEADRGQVVVQVGVAPSEPTEFLIVRITVDAEGQVGSTVTAGAGAFRHE